MAKVCLKCGTLIEDGRIKYCPECGAKIGEAVTTNETVANKSSEKDDLLTAAFILMILSCVGTGWLLIPLLWLIPMTIKINNRRKGGEKLSEGFKICVLLFGNLIAGILLFINDEI